MRNIGFYLILAIVLAFLLLCLEARAEGTTLYASYYSVASLKKEGTWKRSKGVMANGQKFREKALTCATRLYPLGTRLRIVSLSTGKAVVVKVCDRIGERFATSRIDLSKGAFAKIADLKQGIGLIPIRVEVVD